MMKLLRKYNKHLLAIFMTLLMIVFVAGSAFDQLVRPRSNPLVAKSSVGAIYAVDQQQSAGATNLLTSLGLNWKFPDRAASKPLTEWEWTLLTREAAEMGMGVSAEAVRARSEEEPGVAAAVAAVADRFRMKVEGVYGAVAKLRSIQLAAQAIGAAGMPSEAEVRSTAQQVLDKVQVHAVVIPAAAFVIESQEFSPEEMRAQWEKYRDVEPGQGLNFGYFQPIALRAQYIMIDPQTITEQIRVPDLQRKAKRYYEENRESDPRFRRPVPPQTEEGDSAEKESPYMTYEEAQALAEDAVKSEQAKEAAERIANWLVRAAQDALGVVERKDSGYRKIPADIREEDFYLRLVDKIPAEISYPEAAVVGATEFFQQGNAGATPMIGRTTYRPPTGMWKAFATLAFRSEPVTPEMPKENTADRGDYIALKETSPYYLTDNAGRLFVFRIMDVKEPHPAESVEEVREAIVRDLRLHDAFMVAKEHAEDLLHQAAQVGLEDAFAQSESLQHAKETPKGGQIGYFVPSPVARMNRHDVGMGQRTPISAGWGVGTVPPDVVDQWFSLEYTLDKRAVQELKDRATALVVEWVATQRATLVEYDAMREQLMNELTLGRRQELVSRWLDPDNIHARLDFQLVRR